MLSSSGDNNKSSVSNPSQLTSESTSWDQKHRNDKAGGLSTAHSKRQRILMSATKNACLNCKKARAKCDDKKPCTRCNTTAEALPCEYEVNIINAKEELLKRIHELSAKDKLTDFILNVLLSDDQTSSDVLRALKNGDSHERIVEWMGLVSVKEQRVLSPVDASHSSEGSRHEDGGQQSDSPWTYVTRNPTILDDLFSERHFSQSYKTQNHQHCSALLVNAMCALACHFHTPSEDHDEEYDQLVIRFAEAFRADFDTADESITTIQATAVMFLVDLAGGFGLRASSYLRLASEKIAEFSSTTVYGVSTCGYLQNTVVSLIFSSEWARVTFQSPTPLRFRPVENNSDEEASVDESQWSFDLYENGQCTAWPSLLATTNRQKMKLIDVISDASLMMYGSHLNVITAHHVLDLYGRFITWRAALPLLIRDVESSSKALPHVLSLLMLYDYSVVQLLHPLIGHEGLPSMLVEEVVWTHAQHALSLLERHYRARYTCRYQTVFQMLAISSICDFIIRFFPTKSTNDASIKDGPEAIALGLEVLQESFIGVPAAGAIREMLRRAAVGCTTRLPQSMDQLLARPTTLRSTYSYGDFIALCTRPSFRQPLWGVREKFCKGFAEDWCVMSPGCGFNIQPVRRSVSVLTGEPDREAHDPMQIDNLLNAL
ncbi:hypothetical protein ACLOAV_004624 [Pseudogymnoascus australis]